MTDYLLFQLYGPMASWGDIAVGEERRSLTHPSKSALTGILGAALGVRRDEEDRHRRLADGYGCAVRLHSAGVLLSDYHSTQVPPEVALKHHPAATRRDELQALASYLLAAGKTAGTILSRREYRCDAYCRVALWARDGAPAELPELRDALRKPRFTLYLGRKSCPPALPLLPQIVRAPDLRTAFADAEFPAWNDLLGQGDALPRDEALLYWEDGTDSGVASSAVTTSRRRDQVRSRRRWQFEERNEHRARLTEEE